MDTDGRVEWEVSAGYNLHRLSLDNATQLKRFRTLDLERGSVVKIFAARLSLCIWRGKQQRE